MMFNFLADAYNYEQRKIGNTIVNGLRISTCWTSDEGYETAIEDISGVYPVERYSSKKKAEAGHSSWSKKAETLEAVRMLGGFGGLVDDNKIIILQRRQLL